MDAASGADEVEREKRQLREALESITLNGEPDQRCDRCGYVMRERIMGPPICDFCY